MKKRDQEIHRLLSTETGIQELTVWKRTKNNISNNTKKMLFLLMSWAMNLLICRYQSSLTNTIHRKMIRNKRLKNRKKCHHSKINGKILITLMVKKLIKNKSQIQFLIKSRKSFLTMNMITKIKNQNSLKKNLKKLPTFFMLTLKVIF